MKKCSVCLEQKPLSSFFTNGWHPSGKRKYKPMCRTCERDSRYAKYTGIVREFYGELACQVCGYAKSFAALQLHHRDPKEKDHGISAMRHHAEAAIVKELKKCDLLCANCHAEHHWNENRAGN